MQREGVVPQKEGGAKRRQFIHFLQLLNGCRLHWSFSCATQSQKFRIYSRTRPVERAVHFCSKTLGLPDELLQKKRVAWNEKVGKGAKERGGSRTRESMLIKDKKGAFSPGFWPVPRGAKSSCHCKALSSSARPSVIYGSSSLAETADGKE